jgi:hypothetical protein
MKERPILFSGEMVKAILDGRKTQTRRLRGLEDVNKNPDAWTFKKQTALDWMTKKSFKGRFGAYFQSEIIEPKTISICPQAFPYGEVGDRLWVKETHVFEWWEDEPKPPVDRPLFHHAGDGSEWDESYWLWPHYRATDPAPDLVYENDPNDDGEPKCKWRPSIFMPRWASRINLEIVKIRVERLQDISRDDAMFEGVEVVNPYKIEPNLPPGFPAAFRDYTNPNNFFTADPVASFRSLWGLVNKDQKAWNSNPWVWVIKFRRLK